jgi:anti-anti-sigma factor
MEPSGSRPCPRLLGQKAALMPGVELTTSACDGHLVMASCGDLDVTGAADAEAAITALVARGQYLVIDMSALGFRCSALGALLRAQALARRGGGDVVLGAPQPLARRLLALTGNDEVLWVAVGAAVAREGSARGRARR